MLLDRLNCFKTSQEQNETDYHAWNGLSRTEHERWVFFIVDDATFWVISVLCYKTILCIYFSLHFDEICSQKTAKDRMKCYHRISSDSVHLLVFAMEMFLSEELFSVITDRKIGDKKLVGRFTKFTNKKKKRLLEIILRQSMVHFCCYLIGCRCY